MRKIAIVENEQEAKLLGEINRLYGLNAELIEALKRAEAALYAAAQYDDDPAWDAAKETSAALAKAKED